MTEGTMKAGTIHRDRLEAAAREFATAKPLTDAVVAELYDAAETSARHNGKPVAEPLGVVAASELWALVTGSSPQNPACLVPVIAWFSRRTREHA